MLVGVFKKKSADLVVDKHAVERRLVLREEGAAVVLELDAAVSPTNLFSARPAGWQCPRHESFPTARGGARTTAHLLQPVHVNVREPGSRRLRARIGVTVSPDEDAAD